MHILAIFLGGGLGSLARYFLTLGTTNLGIVNFPLGTLLSNILASFILGYVSMYASTDWPVHYRLGWMVGFCGGFSTFSTFTAENYYLFESGNIGYLVFNMAGSIIICLLFFFIGYRLAA